jgi:phosphoglycerate dehydrogenase-like enzyme
MTNRVLCLRPEADFTRVDAAAPKNLAVAYHAPADAQVAALMKSSDALVIPAVGPKLAPDLFEGAKLKLVQVTGAGVDRLDQAALTKLGIPVANVPGGSNSAVAEYCVTAASTLLRRMSWADAELKAGNYVKYRSRMIADNLAGIEGLQVGLVGFGTIGRAVAQAFHRMGAKLCFYDPTPGDSVLAHSLNARAVSLDELLSTSDVVSLHIPLLPATQNLIGSKELARMKPRAILIQASRGGIADEAALAASLSSGHLGGAAVDVYSVEPPQADNPLFKVTGEAASRLLLTPHIAGVTRQASAFLFRSAWQNVERVLVAGQAPLHRVY